MERPASARAPIVSVFDSVTIQGELESALSRH
jgi:hypothetical protein